MKDGGEKYPHLVGRSPQESVESDDVLIGVSPAFQNVIALAHAVAANDCIVILEGESGTGKELIARRIHLRSARAANPFIPVSCPAVTESLFESQFYGHVKGAFTGATTDTLGVVRAAEGGTLLLDEIGEMPLSMQPKLLRLLQEQEVIPVGGTRPVPFDTRFIAATNRNLRQCVADGRFRGDLYHRLNIVRIDIPPLRQRREDIDPLLDYYLFHFAQVYRGPQRHLSDRLRGILREHDWPGNVRELCAYIERLYAAKLPPMPPGVDVWAEPAARRLSSMIHPPREAPRPDEAATDLPVPPEPSAGRCYTLAEVEAAAIRNALEATGHNRTAAAKILDIHRSTLLRKMRHYGLISSPHERSRF